MIKKKLPKAENPNSVKIIYKNKKTRFFYPVFYFNFLLVSVHSGLHPSFGLLISLNSNEFRCVRYFKPLDTRDRSFLASCKPISYLYYTIFFSFSRLDFYFKY